MAHLYCTALSFIVIFHRNYGRKSYKKATSTLQLILLALHLVMVYSFEVDVIFHLEFGFWVLCSSSGYFNLTAKNAY